MTFPSPVGGVSLPGDYAPSILFAALYGLLLPVFIYRFSNKRSRNSLIIGTFSFSVERVIIFSLRAAQVNDEQANHSEVQAYMQTTFGAGFVQMAQDVICLLRALLVNTTYASEDHDVSEKLPALISGSEQSVNNVTQDQPRLRFWFRRYTDGATFLYFIALATGTLSGALYTTGTKSESAANMVMIFRYVSAAIALLLIVMVGWAAMLAHRLPRVKQRGASLICIHSLLMIITCIYRLSVMYHRTALITSTLPGSLNTPAEKTSFYIFHILPEWMSALLLITFNVREEIGTGCSGDRRWRDETPKEKAKREIEEQAKREKKMKQRDRVMRKEKEKEEKEKEKEEREKEKECEKEKGAESSKTHGLVHTFASPAASPGGFNSEATTVRFLPKLPFDYPKRLVTYV